MTTEQTDNTPVIFTGAEINAFDEGVAAGQEHGLDAECPYTTFELRDAWQTGASVGALMSED